MQTWILNSALSSRLYHGTYHCLTAFYASRDEETDSQGRLMSRAAWVLSSELEAKPAKPPALDVLRVKHCPSVDN